jgi:hypothetical protein
MKNKEPWAPKKFGHPKRTLSESDISLTVEIYEEQKSGARRLEKIIGHKYGRHIPHDSILKSALMKARLMKIRKRRSVESPE